MATARPLTILAAGNLSAAALARRAHPRVPATASFSTSSNKRALPTGPPPSNFRLPKPKRWSEGEGALDKAGNYFLLTEMFRGMYVVLEQFFRPP